MAAASYYNHQDPSAPYTSYPPDEPAAYDPYAKPHPSHIRSSSAPKRSRHDGHRSSHRDDYTRGRSHRYRDDRPTRLDSGSSVSRSPPPKSRHHTRRRGRSYDDHDHRSYRDHGDSKHRRGRDRSRSGSYSRGPSTDQSKEIRNAITAAITAGAAEAFRARKEPGGWTGAKGKRILTAAIGAGGIEKLMDHDSGKHSKRNIFESSLAGFAANQLVNGKPRSRSDKRHRRSGSDGGHGGMKDLGAAGLLAAAGKKAYDHYRSKSRHRAPESDYSSDNDGDPRHRYQKKRSQSVTDYVTKGLAALGFTDEHEDKRHSKRRERKRGSDDDDSYNEDYRPRRHERHSRRSR